MPFGLCNAQSTYQRLMANVYRGFIGRICLAYLDDVIVFSKKRVNHIADLNAVIDQLRAAGFKLKPSICAFLREQVLYLGHVISVAGVLPDPENLRVLCEWRVPSKVREMQSFFGFINFYAELSNLQNRRLTVASQRSFSPRSQAASPPITAQFDSSTAHADSITRRSHASHSIFIAAVSANAVTPPMNPRDSSKIFNFAAYGFCDF